MGKELFDLVWKYRFTGCVKSKYHSLQQSIIFAISTVISTLPAHALSETISYSEFQELQQYLIGMLTFKIVIDFDIRKGGKGAFQRYKRVNFIYSKLNYTIIFVKN